jgi:hypothetical protein
VANHGIKAGRDIRAGWDIKTNSTIEAGWDGGIYAGIIPCPSGKERADIFSKVKPNNIVLGAWSEPVG